MRFTLLAVATGAAIGVLLGGRPRYLAGRSLRLVPLLGAGIGLQVAAGPVGGGPGTALVVAAYACLLGFAAANVALVGMWLVALGIALNLAAIAANGAMPVRPRALVAAGVAAPDEVRGLRFDGKRRLERPSDRLLVLSDALPVRPLREVVSFGDVVLATGAADVVAHLLLPASRRRRRARTPPPADTAPAGIGG